MISAYIFVFTVDKLCLQAANMTLKKEDYTVRVPRSQRGGEIVEPLVREQWFVRMQPLAQPALQVSPPPLSFAYPHYLHTYVPVTCCLFYSTVAFLYGAYIIPYHLAKATCRALASQVLESPAILA